MHSEMLSPQRNHFSDVTQDALAWGATRGREELEIPPAKQPLQAKLQASSLTPKERTGKSLEQIPAVAFPKGIGRFTPARVFFKTFWIFLQVRGGLLNLQKTCWGRGSVSSICGNNYSYTEDTIENCTTGTHKKLVGRGHFPTFGSIPLLPNLSFPFSLIYPSGISWRGGGEATVVGAGRKEEQPRDQFPYKPLALPTPFTRMVCLAKVPFSVIQI